MSERVYGRIANVLMLVAIGSALLFDSAKVSHIVVGAIGGAAGVGAIVLYFANQRNSTTKGKTVTDDLPANAGTKAVTEKPAAFTEDPIWTSTAEAWKRMGLYGGGSLERETQQRAVAYLFAATHFQFEYLVLPHHALVHRMRPGHMQYVGEAQLLEVEEAALTPNDVAACAIEIIRHLSSGDDRDRWEFSFGRNGLRISAKTSHPEQPDVSQEDLDFGQKSTMIQ